MAKSHRKGARKSHTRRRSQKQQRQQKQQKNQRRQGGYRLEGASLADSLYGSSSSQMSLAQGDDFDAAFAAAYGGLAQVHFEGITYRRDSGHQVRRT